MQTGTIYLSFLASAGTKADEDAAASFPSVIAAAACTGTNKKKSGLSAVAELLVSAVLRTPEDSQRIRGKHAQETRGKWCRPTSSDTGSSGSAENLSKSRHNPDCH
jgi:hypothetical protein